MKTQLDIRCIHCGKAYPEEGLPYVCPDCGDVFDFHSFPRFSPQQVEHKKTGLWKYNYSFGLREDHPEIHIGEGDTPLVWHSDGKVAYKLESANPTASYKDRASSILIPHMVERGIKYAVEDSSGNAGASFSAYCARAGIQARVYIPESASGPKRKQIEQYGADVVAVPGPRANAAANVLEAALSGIPYASHAYQPFGMLGIATIAYEIAEQTSGKVGTIICPVGHGNLFLGLIYGFLSLVDARILERMPTMIGVQAENCSPVASAYPDQSISKQYQSSLTCAEGVSVSQPVRGARILSMMKEIDGKIMSIPEKLILPARAQLAKEGVFVEPTSALTNAAFQLAGRHLKTPVVFILTGSGYKTNSH